MSYSDLFAAAFFSSSVRASVPPRGSTYSLMSFLALSMILLLHDQSSGRAGLRVGFFELFPQAPHTVRGRGPRKGTSYVLSSLSTDVAVVFGGWHYRFRTMTRHRMMASHRSFPVSL